MDKETYENIIIVISTTGLLFLLGGLVISLLLAGRNRQLKHIAALHETKLNFEKELINTRLEVTENILNEISRDLHDDTGQMLAVAMLQINNIKSQPNEKIDKSLLELQESIQLGLDSVRSISKTLSSDYLGTFGIFESLIQLKQRLAKKGLSNINLSYSEDVLFQSKSYELFTYRIIQELVTNSLKHAKATAITIQITNIGKNLKVTYSDNGIGLSSDLLNNNLINTSLGFTNINKRAKLMGGEIKMLSTPGQGLLFELVFPNY